MKLNRKAVLIAGGFSAALSIGFFAGQALAYQSHMHAALDSLRTARAELQAADADKGGHRVKAIGLVDSAIDEVKEGIDFAR